MGWMEALLRRNLSWNLSGEQDLEVFKTIVGNFSWGDEEYQCRRLRGDLKNDIVLKNGESKFWVWKCYLKLENTHGIM